jgi:hypothetical protein
VRGGASGSDSVDRLLPLGPQRWCCRDLLGTGFVSQVLLREKLGTRLGPEAVEQDVEKFADID